MTDRASPVATRWSAEADGPGLASVHRNAWRYAYAGIIPGLALERMIARRGPAWWSRMHERGFRALVLDCDGTLAGYATLGRSRSAGGPSGEIYELYVRPEYQGCGLGRRLFAEARSRPRGERPPPPDRLGAQRERDRLPLLPRHGRHRGGARRGPLLRRAARQDRLRLELTAFRWLAPPAAAPQSGRMALTLWFHPLASFCHKALIALDEAGIAFEPVVVDLADPASRDAFGAVWPLLKFPVLRDAARGATVAESTAVIEYLDAFHGCGMIPADPDGAWKARMWDRIFDQYVHVPMQKIVTDAIRPGGGHDPHGVAEARAGLAEAYRFLETELPGPWALGEASASPTAPPRRPSSTPTWCSPSARPSRASRPTSTASSAALLRAGPRRGRALFRDVPARPEAQARAARLTRLPRLSRAGTRSRRPREARVTVDAGPNSQPPHWKRRLMKAARFQSGASTAWFLSLRRSPRRRLPPRRRAHRPNARERRRVATAGRGSGRQRAP